MIINEELLVDINSEDTITRINELIQEDDTYNEPIILKDLDLTHLEPTVFEDSFIEVRSKIKLSIINCKIKFLETMRVKTIEIIDSTILTACEIYRCEDIIIKNSQIEKIRIDSSILHCITRIYSDIKNISFGNVIYANNINELSGIENIRINGENGCNLYPICPEEGSFIGYKKVIDKHGNYIIAKLKILEDAKRSSGITRKCRASKVEVLDLYHTYNKDVKCDIAYNAFHSYCENCINDCRDCELTEAQLLQLGTVYEVGKIVEADSFDDNRWNTCTNGIHFFMTEQEARDYNI